MKKTLCSNKFWKILDQATLYSFPHPGVFSDHWTILIFHFSKINTSKPSKMSRIIVSFLYLEEGGELRQGQAQLES